MFVASLEATSGSGKRKPRGTTGHTTQKKQQAATSSSARRGHFGFAFRLELQFNSFNLNLKTSKTGTRLLHQPYAAHVEVPAHSVPLQQCCGSCFPSREGFGEMTGSAGLAFAAGVQRFQANLFHRTGNCHASAWLKTHTGWKRSTLCHLLEAPASWKNPSPLNSSSDLYNFLPCR